MFTSIVVGTDGSETAGEAVRQAVELAKLCGATLHVVTAYKLPTVTGVAALGAEALAYPADLMEKTSKSLHDEVEAMLQRIATDVSREGVSVKTYASSAEPADAIISVAEQEGADLVVVGSRDMSGVRRFMLGSVSNKVSHHAPCSVLIIHTV